MIGATYSDLVSGDVDEGLATSVQIYQGFGGDMYVKNFPAKRTTLQDIAAHLEKLRVDFGFIPEIIIGDYLDLCRPISRSNKNQSEFSDISDVYFDARNLNNKVGSCFITVSQTTKESVDKPVKGIKDGAGSFSKVRDADALWSIDQTKMERRAGLMRLSPQAQRKGDVFTGTEFVYLKVNYETMFIIELDIEEYNRLLEASAVGFEH
jgi:hypothetical protein